MTYRVIIDYLKFDIPDAQTALSFAELAKNCKVNEPYDGNKVTIEIIEEDKTNE